MRFDIVTKIQGYEIINHQQQHQSQIQQQKNKKEELGT